MYAKTSRTAVRRDSCSSVALPRNAKSFAPLRGKPPYGARRLRSRYHTAPPYPFCVARHKETRPKTSRTTERRDSCSSGAKSFAHLRGKPPYGAPNITEPLKGRKNKERIRQIQRQRKDRKAKFGYGITVSLFAWHAIRKRRRTSRAVARRDSCSRGARSAKAAAGNDERAFVRVLSEKEREARKPRQGMTPLKRCDIIDVWSIAFRTYTDTMSCSAA